MTALAANMLALLMVLGLCWLAMMWLSGRFHGHGAPRSSEPDGTGDLSMPMAAKAPCEVCDGVGATTTLGKIKPCPECYGTGVLS